MINYLSLPYYNSYYRTCYTSRSSLYTSVRAEDVDISITSIASTASLILSIFLSFVLS